MMRMLKKALIAYVNSMKAIWSAIAHPLSIVSKRKGTLKGYRIYGNSVQEGENLHDASKATIGVFLGDNGAEITNDTNVMLSDYIEVVSGGIYVIDALNSQSGEKNLRINYFDSEKVWISQDVHSVSTSSTLRKSITIPDGINYIRLSFRKENPLYFYRAVSPENPIEVQSFGVEQLFYADNLFDSEGVKEQGVIRSDGTINPLSSYPEIYCYTIAVNPNTSYTFNSYIINNFLYALYNENMEFIKCGGKITSRQNVTFTTTPDTAYAKICTSRIRVNNGEAVINEGSILSTASYKYKVPVTVRGKNIFNIDGCLNSCLIKNDDGTYTLQKTSNGRFSATVEIYIPANTKFAFGQDLIDYKQTNTQMRKVVGAQLFFTDNSDATLSIYPNTTGSATSDHHVHSFAKDVAQIRLYIRHDDAVGDYITFKNLQIEIGTERTNYEPYIEPQTHNIYLDEPLRKIGDYADCIDGEKSVVVRKCCKKYLKDYKNWDEGSDYNESVWSFSAIDNSIIPSDKNQTGRYLKLALSNMFPITATYSAPSVSALMVYPYARNVRLYLSVECLEDNTVASLTKWLAEYDPYMIRVLATPTEEPIELPKLPQFKGTTIYEVQADIVPSGMEVCYYE